MRFIPEKRVRLRPQYSSAAGAYSPVQRATPSAAYGRASTNSGQANIADLVVLQRTVGNLQLQRIMRSPATSVRSLQEPSGTARTIQRQGTASDGVTTPSDAQNQAQQADANRATLVATQLEQFLERFSNISVTVTWQEEGETRSESVAVHPPYFINRENTARRLSTALGHRTAARGALGDLLRQIRGPAPEVPLQPGESATNQSQPPTPTGPRHGRGRTRRPPPRPRAIQAGDVRGRRRALVGKATPEDIQTILQEALNHGLVPAGNGKTHPDSTDLRSWLVRYGIGVDCSGFVSQALNQVMSAVPGGAAANPLDIANTSASMLTGARGRRARFMRVASPAELRPGDTMGIPGHIRIIMRVETTAEGLQITTAESSSVGDAGPTSAVWLYPDPTRFTRLQRRHAGPPPPPRRARGRRHGRPLPPPPAPVPAEPPAAFHWRPANERVTWGRYRPLAELPTEQPAVQPKSLTRSNS